MSMSVMSISPSKKPRDDENNGDENNPDGSNGASAQEIFGNGDTEVFRTLIPLMKNLDVLKACRLVCKSWNQFASRALRKLPWVYYPINEYCVQDIDNGLQLIIENKNLKLPSPFGTFKISATGFRTPIFLKFLTYLRENTNNYSVHLYISSSNVNTVELQTVLTSSLDNFKITKLILTGKIIGDGPGAHIFSPENIRLPSLKTLGIGFDGLKNDRIVNLCENLCHNSPINSLRIRNTDCGEKLKKVMSPGGMKSVEKLSLNCTEPMAFEDWKYICARIKEIPCIKKLKMYFADVNSHECFGGFEAIIEHFADSLESLTADSLPSFKNKSFPKLRQINNRHFRKFDGEFSYPVERYPLLKKATFVKAQNPVHYPNVEGKSLGIEEIYFKCPGDFDYPDDILNIICAAGMVCPNVAKFSIVQVGKIPFTPAMLIAICKSFPKLTDLELRVEIKDESTLTGLRVIVDEWLEAGWSLDNIPREASFLDFPGLERLTLGPYVFITENLFLHCLSKMPKLQYLTFYLNGDVEAEDIRDSVGHLKRVTVVILLDTVKHHEDWVEEMEILQTMLPSVVEIKKKSHELNPIEKDHWIL